jgi:inosine-uridine nucleoside N-ribohydrolase
VHRQIIIDTDPGQDDAVAILLALASPQELDVLGIVAVAGNVPLRLTERNARMLCELAGRPEVPVYAGCERPMHRALVTAEYIHGKTGLDGPALPEPTMTLQPQHGVDFLIDRLRASAAGSITLCALGPLTNIAMALVKAPDTAGKVAAIVAMAGAYFEVGNVTPAAEFNVYVDPHAAAVVLRSGIPVTMIPLDVSHKALTTRPRIERFRALGTRCSVAVAEMLDFFERHDVEKYGFAGGPLHDPCVIAYLLRPELLRGRKVNVEVETGSQLTLGMTVADWWGVTDRPRNVMFMNDIDADGFYDLLTERIARLP